LRRAWPTSARTTPTQSLAIFAISSNDVVTHPADSPAELKQQAESCGFNFPYLYDETQAVARAYKAALHA